MDSLIRRVLGESAPPESIDGFVALQPNGEPYTAATAAHGVLFSRHKAMLERSLPPGHAVVVPATLIIHHDHANPV